MVEQKEKQLNDLSKELELKEKQLSEISRAQELKEKQINNVSESLAFIHKQLDKFSQERKLEDNQMDGLKEKEITSPSEAMVEKVNQQNGMQDIGAEQEKHCSEKLELKGKQMKDEALNPKSQQQTSNQKNIPALMEGPEVDIVHKPRDNQPAALNQVADVKESQVKGPKMSSDFEVAVEEATQLNMVQVASAPDPLIDRIKELEAGNVCADKKLSTKRYASPSPIATPSLPEKRPRQSQPNDRMYSSPCPPMSNGPNQRFNPRGSHRAMYHDGSPMPIGGGK